MLGTTVDACQKGFKITFAPNFAIVFQQFATLTFFACGMVVTGKVFQ